MIFCADIIRELLLDLSLAEEGEIFTSFLPNDPDSAVCVYDTAGRSDGRVMETGEQVSHPGVQIRVRGANYPAVTARVQSIANNLSSIRKVIVALESGASYLVHNVSRSGEPLSLGMEEEGDRRRYHFTINFLVTITPETVETVLV